MYRGRMKLLFLLIKAYQIAKANKAYAAAGATAIGGAGVAVLAMSIGYTDTAIAKHSEQEKEVKVVEDVLNAERHKDILWRLEVIARGQNDQARDLDKLDRRIWEIGQKVEK